MIRYSLKCDSDHEFESWFRDSTAFDAVAAAGELSCPFCGSGKVEKAIMAPALVKGRGRPSPAIEPPTPPAPAVPAQSGDAPQGTVALGPEARALREMIRTLHRKIAETAEDVGRAFPEEARRMHEGEEQQRPIYGQATGEEVRELLEDGVPVLPIPTLPDDGH